MTAPAPTAIPRRYFLKVLTMGLAAGACASWVATTTRTSRTTCRYCRASLAEATPDKAGCHTSDAFCANCGRHLYRGTWPTGGVRRRCERPQAQRIAVWPREAVPFPCATRVVSSDKPLVKKGILSFEEGGRSI